MFCSLFGSLVSGKTDSQKCPGNFCWINEQMAVCKTCDLSNALFYGRWSWDPLKRTNLRKGKAGTGPEISASSLMFSPHPKICLSWMKFLGKSESKNHIMIQCLAIMTNFGAHGEFLEVTTILPTKYQYYKLLLVKKLVGVHHIHRNSWKLRERLSQNWSPMAQSSEIQIVLRCEMPVNQMLWYFGGTTDCLLNKISSNLSQRAILHGAPNEILCSSCAVYVQKVTARLVAMFLCCGLRLHSTYVMQFNQFISRLILGDTVKYHLELKENKSKIRLKPATVPT